METLFFELGMLITKRSIIWCDNQSVNALNSNFVFHAWTKHIKIDVYYIRDQVTAKNMVVQYVYTKHQKVDILISCTNLHG